MGLPPGGVGWLKTLRQSVCAGLPGPFGGDPLTLDLRRDQADPHGNDPSVPTRTGRAVTVAPSISRTPNPSVPAVRSAARVPHSNASQPRIAPCSAGPRGRSAGARRTPDWSLLSPCPDNARLGVANGLLEVLYVSQ